MRVRWEKCENSTTFSTCTCWITRDFSFVHWKSCGWLECLKIKEATNKSKISLKSWKYFFQRVKMGKTESDRWQISIVTNFRLVDFPPLSLGRYFMAPIWPWLCEFSTRYHFLSICKERHERKSRKSANAKPVKIRFLLEITKHLSFLHLWSPTEKFAQRKRVYAGGSERIVSCVEPDDDYVFITRESNTTWRILLSHRRQPVYMKTALFIDTWKRR